MNVVSYSPQRRKGKEKRDIAQRLRVSRVIEMGVLFTFWRILFFVLLSLVLAQDCSARKLSSYMSSKGLVIDPIYGSNDKDSKEEIIDLEIGSVNARFPISYERDSTLDPEKGSTSKQDVIEQVSRDNNPIDDHFRIYSKQNNLEAWENSHHQHGKNDDHQGHVQMEPEDPSTIVFFQPSNLKVGQKLEVYFPNKDPSTSPQFLPKEEADSIPLTSSQLPYLLELFNLPKDSPQAKAVEDTLSMCEVEPIKGETMFCATSLESMIDFVRSIFGLGTQLKVLANLPLKKPIKPLQNYTILEEPKEMKALRMVGCHTMPYPYVIYYCHSQKGHDQAKVFQVLLDGEDGGSVLAAAVCHMDTSNWDRDHVSFRILKIEPGTAPVCHFLPPDNLVWLPVTA